MEALNMGPSRGITFEAAETASAKAMSMEFPLQVQGTARSKWLELRQGKKGKKLG